MKFFTYSLVIALFLSNTEAIRVQENDDRLKSVLRAIADSGESSSCKATTTVQPVVVSAPAPAAPSCGAPKGCSTCGSSDSDSGAKKAA